MMRSPGILATVSFCFGECTAEGPCVKELLATYLLSVAQKSKVFRLQPRFDEERPNQPWLLPQAADRQVGAVKK